MKYFLKQYLMALFLWNPLVCVLIEFGSGNYHIFGPSLIISLTVGTITATVCIIGTELCLSIIKNIFNLSENVCHKKLEALLTMALVTPGLFVGNEAAKVILHELTGSVSASTLFSGYFYAGLVIFIAFSSMTMSNYKNERRRLSFQMQKLEIENLKSKVSSLSSQMNPHFLFNSLNSIAAIIPDDPKAAELMTVRLADVYRGILKASRSDKHSLFDELNICRDYLEIEKIRFGARLRAIFLIEDGIELKKINTPVLIIQTLIENSVKHGLSPKIMGGSIQINIYSQEKHLFVEIVDDGLGINAHISQGAQSSLINCKERLKILYKGAAIFKTQIDDKGSQVIFGIPTETYV